MNKLLLIPVVGLVLLVDYLVGYYKPEFTLNEIHVFFKMDRYRRPLRWVNGVRYRSGHLQGMEKTC